MTTKGGQKSEGVSGLQGSSVGNNKRAAQTVKVKRQDRW